VQEPPEIGCRPPERDAQIGTADVPDEQRVARQDRVRPIRAPVEVEYQNRDRLRRVARRFQRDQADMSQIDHVAVMERGELVLRAGGGAKVDAGAGSIPKLKVAGEEVRVKMRQQNMANLDVMGGSDGEVLIDVTLRIDDNRGVGAFIADEIRSVCETA